MYAINHAATALVIKKKYPSVSTLWLLLAVQAAEVLRVIFQFTGIEHISVADNKMHLDYRWRLDHLAGARQGLQTPGARHRAWHRHRLTRLARPDRA